MKMPILSKALCRNIRAARQKTGLTQEKIAEALGISPLHYGRLERGKRIASLKQLAEIAQVLNCSAFSLLKGCFPEDTGILFCETDVSVFAQKISAILAGCSVEEQELIYEISRLIAYRNALGEK